MKQYICTHHYHPGPIAEEKLKRKCLRGRKTKDKYGNKTTEPCPWLVYEEVTGSKRKKKH